MRKPHLVSSTRIALGYGIVCGLIFPLMISSTYLQAMSLSHGAGNLFGLLFFSTYAATMLGSAALLALARRKQSKSPHSLYAEDPSHAPLRWRVPSRLMVGVICAFLGNALMLVRHLGILDLGVSQTIVMALLIGAGLALAEISWLGRISLLGEISHRMRLVAASFLVGSITASFIFVADGPLELSFALVTLICCLLLATRPARPSVTNSCKKAPVGQATVMGRPNDTRFITAALCHVVFSFVFGAVSQASILSAQSVFLTELQAIGGIVIAALIALAMASPTLERFVGTNLYWTLFPLVAVTLVALPFIRQPIVLAIAVVLVFVSFYLAGIQVRSEAGRFGETPPIHAELRISLALGLGACAVLAGVALGAVVLSSDSSGTALTCISLVSLFVLSMSPNLARVIEGRRARKGRFLSTADLADPADTCAPTSPAFRAHDFARFHALTDREAEVLALICQGRTRTYIAQELGISPNTAKGYIHNIYQKVGVTDKQALIDSVELWSTGQQKSRTSPEQLT